MKSKILFTFLLAAIFALALVSAADFSVTQPSELTKAVTETTFTITNNINDSITVDVPVFDDLTDGDGNTILLNQDVSGNVEIPTEDSVTVTLTYALDAGVEIDELALGEFSDSIEIVNVADETQTLNVIVEFISSFCEEGNREKEIDEGVRTLEIVHVKDRSSDNDWEWKPLDEVEIEVKVTFDSDDNNDDIDAIIEIGLYDTEENEFIDIENGEDLERDISLDTDDDKVTETFNIIVPVEDMDDSTSRYRFYAKVYEDGDEEVLCADVDDDEYYQKVEIEKESYDVVLDRLDLTTPVPCGEEVEITARVYNIGSHDEDRVIVNVLNKDLNIDLQSNPFDLDEGDSRSVSFNFRVPEDAEEGTYQLRLWNSFKYKSSTETYREESDSYNLILTVEGNCEEEIEEVRSAFINAELDAETPEAIAGKQVIIKSTVRNTGTVPTVYAVDVTGNSVWSSLSAIDPQTVSLNPGESRIVNIYLDIDENAVGENDFTITAAYEGGQDKQEVVLEIAESVTQDEVVTHLRENWFIYVIAIINIILIIAIIAVVKSMVGRNPAR